MASEIVRVSPLGKLDLPGVNRLVFEINTRLQRLAELTERKASALKLHGDLDANDFRIKNVAAPADDDDVVTVGRLNSILDTLDDIDTETDTSEGDEEGQAAGTGRGGGRGSRAARRDRRTARMRRVIDDEITQAILDSIPTTAPPEVETAGAVGTTTDPTLFALSDHTHSGVNLSDTQTIGGQKTFTLSPIITPLTAGRVVFAGASKELDDDAALFWDDATKRLGIGNAAPTEKLDITGNAALSGYAQWAASSTPSTPAAGFCRVYALTTGGITRLVMLTNSGQEVAFFRDLVQRVINRSGVTILAGAVVFVQGVPSTGLTPVELAKADMLVSSAVFGVMKSPSTADNDFGTVQLAGIMSNLDTSAFVVGNTLYLSDAVDGALTIIAPSDPSLTVPIAVVLVSDVAVGSIALLPPRTSTLSTLQIPGLSQYALLAGRAGGQSLSGDTAASGNFTLSSTAHATKGKIIFSANSAWDEANTRLGIGTQAPGQPLDIQGATQGACTFSCTLAPTANNSGARGKMQAAGTSLGAPSALSDKDIIGTFQYLGHDGSAYTLAAEMRAVAQEAFGASNHGTRMDFRATSKGIAGPLIRKIIGLFNALANNTVTSLISLTLASNTVAAAKLAYAVEVFDGTELQVEIGTVIFMVTNKAGVIANNVALKGTFQQATTGGTLAVTFTITAANPAVIKVNANSSLTPSAGYPRLTHNLEYLTSQSISIV